MAGRSVKDPEMLQWWGQLDVMLLTTDSRMISDHTRFVPNKHKGITVISPYGHTSPDLPRIGSILAAFKLALPQWPMLSLDNSILELWVDCPTHDVSVAHVKDGQVVCYDDFSYSSPDWPANFLHTLSLARNA